MEACRAIAPLRQCKVSAAELMDRNALHAVEDEPGMPEILHSLPEDAVALLIDTSSNSEEELQPIPGYRGAASRYTDLISGIIYDRSEALRYLLAGTKRFIYFRCGKTATGYGIYY